MKMKVTHNTETINTIVVEFYDNKDTRFLAAQIAKLLYLHLPGEVGDCIFDELGLNTERAWEYIKKLAYKYPDDD